MIVMLASLNKRETVLKGKVSCYTCHRGKQEPEGVPAMPMMDNGPRPPQPGGEPTESGR